MDEYIDSLGKATVFSTLNANSGYWQIEIYEKHRDETAFTSNHGPFQVIRISFGLRNALGIFLTNTGLHTVTSEMTVCLSKPGWHHHLLQVTRATQELCPKVANNTQKRGRTLKLKKYRLFTEIIDFVVHMTRPRRMKIASHTTDAIHGLHAPTDLMELRSFLGLCIAFRRFVQN